MSTEAAEAPPVVRMCKLGMHELPKSSGQCMECKREKERQKKNAQSDRRRAERGLAPIRMCGRGLHKMVGDNLAVEHRTRLDGAPYVIERCYACSTMAKSKRKALRKALVEGGEKPTSLAAQRMADARRIDEIHAEILAMCDQLELASTYELSLMRERRAELTRERDRLERGDVNTALRKAAIRYRGAYQDTGN